MSQFASAEIPVNRGKSASRLARALTLERAQLVHCAGGELLAQHARPQQPDAKVARESRPLARFQNLRLDARGSRALVPRLGEHFFELQPVATRVQRHEPGASDGSKRLEHHSGARARPQSALHLSRSQPRVRDRGRPSVRGRAPERALASHLSWLALATAKWLSFRMRHRIDPVVEERAGGGRLCADSGVHRARGVRSGTSQKRPFPTPNTICGPFIWTTSTSA